MGFESPHYPSYWIGTTGKLRIGGGLYQIALTILLALCVFCLQTGSVIYGYISGS